MKKYVILSLLTTVTIASLFAQTQNEALFDPFKASLRPAYNDSLPKFVKMTLQPNPNMFEVAEAHEAYEKEHEGTNDKDIENLYDVYFERWRRAYSPFMQEDGTIKLPKFAEVQQQLKAQNDVYNAHVLNSISSTESTTANWTCVGPKETYFLKDEIGRAHV